MKAVMETSLGTITLELNEDKAPETVRNFAEYVTSGHYDGTIFHRVIAGFMIQGGDPTGTGMGGPGFTIKGEFSANGFANNLSHTRGVISMARAQDYNSAGSQFFINLVDNDFLNFTSPTPQGFGYAVFGKVTDGMDVVDQIAKVKTGFSGPHQNVPEEPVVIKKVALV